MGFIKWHGEKEDHYEDVVEFAQETAKIDAEKFQMEQKRKEAAEFFQVMELLPLKNEEILRLLVKEKRGMDMIYEELVQKDISMENTQEKKEITAQFYADFFLSLLNGVFYQTKVPEEKKKKLIQALFSAVFKVESSIPVSEYFERIGTCKEYQDYMEQGFGIKSGNASRFWQWMGYLSQKNAGEKETGKFIRLYFRLQMHLSFYMEQMCPDARIGNYLVKQRRLCEEIIRYSLKAIGEFQKEGVLIENPLFRIHREEAEAEEEKKKFISEMKYAKILLGYCILEEEDEEDMITAGRLYAWIRKNITETEQITGIFPKKSEEFTGKGSLPVIEPKEVGISLEENEILHYVENAVHYIEDEKGFSIQKGCMFITSQRIRMETGREIKEIRFEELKKAVLYDALPEVIEIAGREETLFLQSADTGDTYSILRMILNTAEKPQTQPVNMEKLSLEYFAHEDIETYLFSLKSFTEAILPEEMKQNLDEMVLNLENLNETLKKYPSHSQQAHRFVTYYIPEVIRLMFSFMEYEKAGVSSQRLNPVYERVVSSIKKVSQAAVQRVDEIYKISAMETMAKADALQKIMGQDGYTKPGETILKL